METFIITLFDNMLACTEELNVQAISWEVALQQANLYIANENYEYSCRFELRSIAIAS